jgi:hypothetical protein
MSTKVKPGCSVQKNIGIQVLDVKIIQHCCPFLWDMGIAKYLSDNRSIFTFNQSIIIGLP